VSGQAEGGVRLRPVDSNDAMLLFDWLNRPDRIASSLQTSEPVPLQRHIAWLADRLADEHCELWILETAAGPAGQLRLQDRPEGAEVSVYVAPEFRGRGIAAQALRAAAEHCRTRLSHGRLLARVRHDNPGSFRLFSRAGYAVIAEHADHVLMAADAGGGPSEVDPA
jgi:RimJ/RimL family protein N-acetyltransferase